MRVLTIALVSLRRVLRDRTSIFFVFALPFLIILALGVTFGGSFTAKLGVVAEGSGALGERLVDSLDAVDSMEVRRFDDVEALVAAVERRELEAGLVIPEGYDRVLREGGQQELSFVAQPGTLGEELRLTIGGVLAEQDAILRAATFAEEEGAEPFAPALARAEALGPRIPAVTVRSSVAGGNAGEDENRFGGGAAQQLILFMFVTSLGFAGHLIEVRRLGLARRMLSTPITTATVILGETLGRFVVALFQAAVILVATVVLFGVNWGDPLATGTVVVLFALVGTGAAMLLGSVLQNAQQAGSLGVFFGLGMAALGGCMVPLEVFPDTMRTIAHATPHAWAVDALTQLVVGGAGIADVLTEIAILAGFSVVLLAVSVRLLHRSITG